MFYCWSQKIDLREIFSWQHVHHGIRSWCLEPHFQTMIRRYTHGVGTFQMISVNMIYIYLHCLYRTSCTNIWLYLLYLFVSTIFYGKMTWSTPQCWPFRNWCSRSLWDFCHSKKKLWRCFMVCTTGIFSIIISFFSYTSKGRKPSRDWGVSTWLWPAGCHVLFAHWIWQNGHRCVCGVASVDARWDSDRRSWTRGCW